jgi:endonuclease YncB( thermonuclease family)
MYCFRVRPNTHPHPAVNPPGPPPWRGTAFTVRSGAATGATEVPVRSSRFRTNVRPLVLATSVILTIGCSSRQPPDYHPTYRGAKLVSVSEIRFDDGDTFEYQGKPIRVLGIDTPEIAHPDMGIYEGQPYGTAAAESTRVWLTRARAVEIVFDGRDLYNRRLAHVFIDGELLACRLIRHGLAYETVSHYGDSGYPDLAQEILDTARQSPPPRFEPPYKWKQKHRPKKRG